MSGGFGSLPADFPEGRIIGGRYRIESLLGEGGTARVFRAHDLATQSNVALKVIKARYMRDDRAGTRLAREGEMLRRLSHPGVVRVDTWGQDEGGPFFLAMELLSGETLAARLRRGPLSLRETDRLLRQIIAPVRAAHEAHIIHRDLKPDNIFLAKGDTSTQVKIVDFGISKVVGAEKLTKTGQMLGTPRYMAPEQLSAAATVDAEADIYAIGMIVFEMLSGRSPFSTQDPMKLIIEILHGRMMRLSVAAPSVPATVEAVVGRCLQISPETRYRKIDELEVAWTNAVEAHLGTHPGRGLRERVPTASLGLLTDPSTVLEDSEDRISETSGTFSDLIDANAAEKSSSREAGPTAGQRMRTSRRRTDAEITAQPGVDSLRRVVRTTMPSSSSETISATTQSKPAGSGALLDDATPRVSIEIPEAARRFPAKAVSPLHPDHLYREVSFWRTLRRVHFLGMLLFALAGAVCAGIWVWHSVESRRALQNSSQHSLEATSADPSTKAGSEPSFEP